MHQTRQNPNTTTATAAATTQKQQQQQQQHTTTPSLPHDSRPQNRRIFACGRQNLRHKQTGLNQAQSRATEKRANPGPKRAWGHSQNTLDDVEWAEVLGEVEGEAFEVAELMDGVEVLGRVAPESAR